MTVKFLIINVLVDVLNSYYLMSSVESADLFECNALSKTCGENFDLRKTKITANARFLLQAYST